LPGPFRAADGPKELPTANSASHKKPRNVASRSANTPRQGDTPYPKKPKKAKRPSWPAPYIQDTSPATTATKRRTL